MPYGNPESRFDAASHFLFHSARVVVILHRLVPLWCAPSESFGNL